MGTCTRSALRGTGTGEANALWATRSALWARRMRCGRHAVRHGRGECAVGEANVLGSIHYRKVFLGHHKIAISRSIPRQKPRPVALFFLVQDVVQVDVYAQTSSSLVCPSFFCC